MITDSLDNAPAYFKIAKGITKALEFLRQPDLAKLPTGKHAIDDDRIFALVQEYQTKTPDQTFWETHRKYIDVQYVQSGVEAMGWSPMQRMKLRKEYDPQRDIIVWDGAGQLIQVPAGSFVIFMPQDAHMGGLLIDQPGPVRKIVVKVSLD